MSSLSRRAQLACGPPDVRVAPWPAADGDILRGR